MNNLSHFVGFLLLCTTTCAKADAASPYVDLVELIRIWRQVGHLFHLCNPVSTQQLFHGSGDTHPIQRPVGGPREKISTKDLYSELIMSKPVELSK